MMRFKTLALTLAALVCFSTASRAADDWKGTTEDSEMMLGAMSGLGIIDGTAGFALLGTASKKIVAQGFASDIANSVSVETQLGPVFISGTSVFAYSGHLRWDFQKDEKWTFYALGGIGGNISGAARGNRFEIFPRFGMGVLCDLFPNVLVRGELSHEFITGGIAIPFWF